MIKNFKGLFLSNNNKTFASIKKNVVKTNTTDSIIANYKNYYNNLNYNFSSSLNKNKINNSKSYSKNQLYYTSIKLIFNKKNTNSSNKEEKTPKFTDADEKEKELEINSQESSTINDKEEKFTNKEYDAINNKSDTDTISLKKYNLLKELYDDSENSLQKARSKFDELRKAYIDSQNDLERIRKRSEVELAQAKEYSVTKFAKDILDVKDNFERALICLNDIEKTNEKETANEDNQNNSTKELKAYKDFAEGVLMTKDSLVRILGMYGIKEYNPLKEKFDPSKHEAVFQSTSKEMQPGTISDVMQTGFMIGNRVLRPAKVGVVKK